jgi:hypothetical protein
MPPSAILLVRAMADPLPGRITKGFAPAALASAEWERAAQNRLGAFYASAVRPIWGPVPSSTAAVLFADDGELLACLARDLASGAPLGWWWHSILRHFPSRLPGSWAAVWAEQPRYIPAALGYLEARQLAAKVLERIAPVQAWNLLMAVLREFNLPGLTMTRGPTGVREPRSSEPDTLPTVWRAENAAAGPAEETAELGQSAPAAIARLPWEYHVPRASTPPELGYERRALLGVALLLRRSPQAVFAPSFALQFSAWVRAEESRGRAQAADPPPSHILPGTVERRERAHWEAGPAPAPGLSTCVEGAFLPAAEPDRPDGQQRGSPLAGKFGHSMDELRQSRARVLDASAATVASTPAEPNQPHGHRRDSARAETTYPTADQLPQSLARAWREADVPASTVASTRAREWEAGEFTRAGGILYLIHLLRRLELLRHFDTGLGAWELLELLARCLLDDAGNLADDAIWAALAHLAGRDPRTPPGSGFEPQRTYTAPESWMEFAGIEYAGARRFARFRSRGMEIWSAEGFLVLDSEDAAHPAGAAARITSSRRRKLRRAARVRPIRLSVSPELRRFLHFVLPFARWRLERALRGIRVEDALLRAGRLYVTATHVDLVMPMNEISVPVRLAGLDANPGWAPELGRVVNFHFVQEGY